MGDDQPDLATQLSRVKQRLFAAERPVLDRRGLTMWDYIALIKLSHGAAPTQLALSEQMGYDKTRLITLLDGLADRGLVVREPDPEDRRAKVVCLTDSGRRALKRTRAEIREVEQQLFEQAGIGEAQAAALRATLGGLADATPEPLAEVSEPVRPG